MLERHATLPCAALACLSLMMNSHLLCHVGRRCRRYAALHIAIVGEALL